MEKQDSDSSDMRHDSQLKKRRKSPERDGERKREKQTRSTGWLVADSGRGGRLIRGAHAFLLHFDFDRATKARKSRKH